MDLFGGFHDSCLKELHMWTWTSVDENFSMRVSIGLDTCARLLFQRKVPEPSAIELLFKGDTQFHMIPHAEGGDSIIYGEKLLVKEGLFYWAEDEDWHIEHPFLHSISWISANGLYYVSTWMGEELRYGVIGTEETL